MTKLMDDISGLRALVYSGDWDKATGAVQAFSETPVPADPRELAQYRQQLHEALIVARAARAGLAAELNRLQVSSVYQNGTSVPKQRSTPVWGGHTV